MILVLGDVHSRFGVINTQISHAETLTGLRTGLVAQQPSVYRRPGSHTTVGATATAPETCGSRM